MRLAALALLAAVALTACGSKRQDAYDRANIALLDRLPVYPGSASPRTTTSGETNTKFGARDWTLPKGATAAKVVGWYEHTLQEHGWRITGESFGTIRAVRKGAAISIGARERTLEIVANSRGG
ncbi:MAG TPA: hypothetical protein VFJ93_06010 [Gaiellaceae bacterium]|nr:hypothetical protein [Gaiellaceae bacterium]